MVMEKLRLIYRGIARYFDEITLLGLAGFLFLVATNTQSGWLFFVIAFILGLLIFNALTAFLNLEHLELKRSFASSVVEDDSLEVVIRVSNGSFLPKLFLLIEDGFPVPEPEEKPPALSVPYVPPRGQVIVKYKRKAYRRGVYQFSPARVQVWGFLGFFTLERRIDVLNSSLTVLPRTIPMSALSIHNRNSTWGRGEKTFPFYGRSHDFTGIREYQPGHETRFIHWPSTARHGRLMVKEFNEITSHSISVALETFSAANVGEGRETTLEYMIRAAAGLLDRAHQGRYSYNLYVPNGSSIQQFRRLSREAGGHRLALLGADGSRPIEGGMDEILEMLDTGGQLFLFKVFPFSGLEELKKLSGRKVKLTVVFFLPLPFAAPGQDMPGGLTIEDYRSQARELEKVGVEALIYVKDSGCEAAQAGAGVSIAC